MRARCAASGGVAPLDALVQLAVQRTVPVKRQALLSVARSGPGRPTPSPGPGLALWLVWELEETHR